MTLERDVDRLRADWQARGLAPLAARLPGFAFLPAECWSVADAPLPEAPHFLALAHFELLDAAYVVADLNRSGQPISVLTLDEGRAELRLLAASFADFVADLVAFDQLLQARSDPLGAQMRHETALALLHTIQDRARAAVDIRLWVQVLVAAGWPGIQVDPAVYGLLAHPGAGVTRPWIDGAELSARLADLQARLDARPEVCRVSPATLPLLGQQVIPLAAGRHLLVDAQTVGDVLEDWLVPGFFLTRRLDRLILVCHDLAAECRLAVVGPRETILAAIGEAPVPGMTLMDDTACWRVDWVAPTALRVSGAPWTRFYPWRKVSQALLGGVAVTLLVHAPHLDRLLDQVSQDFRRGEVGALLFCGLPGIAVAALTFATLQRRSMSKGCLGWWIATVLLTIWFATVVYELMAV